MTTVVITGASSGLGRCIKEAMENDPSMVGINIINWSLDQGVDVRDMKSIRSIGIPMIPEGSKVDILINCAGINHIDFIPDLKEEDWDKVINTNAKGIFLTTQALLPWMKDGTILNIVSNASRVAMTGSLAYNASKFAALGITKQLSRELGKTHGITVFSISPNKLTGTGMTDYIDSQVCKSRGWTVEEAKNYQLASLPAGVETNPETLAEFISFLLSTKERHRYLQGCDITYGGP